MSDTIKREKHWLKRNATQDLLLMTFAATWLVLVWELDFKIVAVAASVLAVAQCVVLIRERKKRADQEARAKREVKNKEDARAYFALAIKSLDEGDTDSALKAYETVEELDEALASELYDQIFD